ncbi:MAG TPA: peptidoglycan editing factor PgeF [Candidatus Limnocylindrales bacterium]|nr:peptidoglycan editing factor PgeF [Candidatus Limnocylindrales bacterium]
MSVDRATSGRKTTPWPERDGLLRSPALEALGLVAAYTTRALGTMAGAARAPDDPEGNRSALAARLGFPAVVRVKQVHGDRVVRADGAAEPWPEADGLWSDRQGVLLGVAAADCVPVLVALPGGPIGAAHAGWQGTSLRIAGALVRELASRGAAPDRLIAAVGPSIGPCCYEVGEERVATIRARLGGDADASLRRRDGRIVFDLWTANAEQLRAAGVRAIEVAGLCTKCGGADTWSYRGRADRGEGMGLAVIGRPGRGHAA